MEPRRCNTSSKPRFVSLIAKGILCTLIIPAYLSLSFLARNPNLSLTQNCFHA